MSYEKMEKNLKRDKETKKQLMKLKKDRFVAKTLLSLKLLYPCLIDVGVVAAFFSAMGYAPFYRDNVKSPMYIKRTEGIYANEKPYVYYSPVSSMPNGYILSYSKWYKSDNGKYQQLVKKYNIDKIDDYVVSEFVNDPNNIKRLEDVFGKSVLDEIIEKDSITEEELKTPAYMEATIYSVDMSKVTKLRQTLEDSEEDNLCFLGLSFLSMIIVMGFRDLKWDTFKHYFEDMRGTNNYYHEQVGDLDFKLRMKKKTENEDK